MNTDELRQQLADNDKQRQAIRSRALEERKHYEDKIKELDQLLAKLVTVPSAAKTPKPPAPQAEGRGRGRPPTSGVGQAVADYVTAHPWLTVRQLVSALSTFKEKSVDSTVRALATDGRLIHDHGSPRRFAIPGTPLPVSNGAKPAAVATA